MQTALRFSLILVGVRRELLLSAALGATNTGVVVALDWLLRRRSDFGWYSYSPMPRRHADYLPTQHVLSGWAAVGIVAAVLVAVNMVIAAAYAVIRHRKTAAA